MHKPHHRDQLNQHLAPLKRRARPVGHLPANAFGSLTGDFDHWTLQSERGGPDNPNHVYVWVKVPDGSFAGAYEAAVNVHSVAQAGLDSDNLQYAVINEEVPVANWSAAGFGNAQLAYRQLGLTPGDFHVVETGALRDLVVSYAAHCQRLTVFGHTYADGTGLHDVHLNSGNPPGRFRNFENQDGALAFYFDDAHGGPEARWVFLKFQSQAL